jgi:hypothetical protein
MTTIEPELCCPAPRHTRLRGGARFWFGVNLGLFLLLGGLPLVQVTHQILLFQTLERDGQSAEGTVLRRHERLFPAGVRIFTLDCVYASTSGKAETATVAVPRHWWLASPTGSSVPLTTCDEMPGNAAFGDPGELQLSGELGLGGSGLLILGLAALLLFGSRLRPYFRDVALVSLGAPVSGRVVGRTMKVVRRFGWKLTLPMIHLQFRDPYGVERVRTQVVDRRTWDRVTEGSPMTVLVCARRRGWFAAYPLLLAEATPLPPVALVTVKSERP